MATILEAKVFCPVPKTFITIPGINDNMKIHKSFVCMVELTPAIIALAVPGMVQIPSDVLAPRQIELLSTACKVPSSLRFHRDMYVPMVSKAEAEWLVNRGDARYCEQSLLFYTMDKYLSDPDVLGNKEEHVKASASGAELVLVAVIGNNRSCESVCRNIVSGCQDPLKLIDDARGALSSANTFLIGD